MQLGLLTLTAALGVTAPSNDGRIMGLERIKKVAMPMSVPTEEAKTVAASHTGVQGNVAVNVHVRVQKKRGVGTVLYSCSIYCPTRN